MIVSLPFFAFGQTPDLSSAFEYYLKAKDVAEIQKLVNPHLLHLPANYRDHFKKLLTPFKGVRLPILTVLNRNEYMLSSGSFGMTARFSEKSFLLNGRLVHIDWSQKPEKFEREIVRAIQRKFSQHSFIVEQAFAAGDNEQKVKVFAKLTQAFLSIISTNLYCKQLLHLLGTCRAMTNIESPPFSKNRDLVLKLIGKSKEVKSKIGQCQTYGHKIKSDSLKCAVDSGYKIALKLAQNFASGKYKKSRTKMRKVIMELMDNVIIAHELNGGQKDSLNFPKIESSRRQEQ